MGFVPAVLISLLFVLILLGLPRSVEGALRCVTCNSDGLTPGTPVSSCTAETDSTDPGFGFGPCKGAEQCSVSYISGYNTTDYVDGVKMDRKCRNLTDPSMTYYVPTKPSLLCIKVPLSNTNVRIECFCSSDMCNAMLTYAPMKAMAKLLPFTTNPDPAQYFVAEINFDNVNASTAVGYVTVKPATYWAGGTTRSYNASERYPLSPPTNPPTPPPFISRFNRTTLALTDSKRAATATDASAAPADNRGLIAGLVAAVVVVAAIATGVSVWWIRRHNAIVRQRKAARNDAAAKRFDAL